MIDEHVCLKNLKRILSERSDDQRLKKLSTTELQPMYREIANNIFRISMSNVHKFKSMLWNYDNLKSEIRLKFQNEILDKWYSAYEQSIQNELPKNRPEKEKQDCIVITEEEVSMETETQDSIPAPEDFHKRQEKEPVETVSDTRSSILTGQIYKRDWFDRFLDAVASAMGCFS
jgi:hypothetical protein